MVAFSSLCTHKTIFIVGQFSFSQYIDFHILCPYASEVCKIDKFRNERVSIFIYVRCV